MEMTKELINKIRDVVDEMELDWEYDYIGIRVQEVPFELGAMDHVSHVWVDGTETEEELNGVCCTDIKRIEEAMRYYHNSWYYGDHMAIVCGNRSEYGEDVGEIIIKDAEVACIIC